MRTALLLVLALGLQAQVMRWTRFEAELRADDAPANPVQDVSVTVEFLSPTGKRHTIPAFWDGGETWRVRFSPDETGAWKWGSRSEPKTGGLDGRTGSFDCAPYAGSNPLYLHGPLRISADGHRFVQADGTPFFWLGDTLWNGPLLADARDWEVILEDRARKGFNVVQFVTTRWAAAYADAAGRIPYTGRERIDIDPVFFQRLDARIDAINAHGLIGAPVLLWAHASQPALNPGIELPPDQMIVLARYMVARYGAHQVVWMLNGDGQYGGQNASVWKRVGSAVFKGAHPDRLATMHPGRRTWIDEFEAEPWVHFAGYQSGHRDDAEHIRWLVEGPPATRWRRDRPVPAINLEPNYEAHRNRTAGATNVFGAYEVRRAAYWSVLVSPTAGVSYGAHGLWSWQSISAEPLNRKGTGGAAAWRDAMQLPGSYDMQRLKTLMSTLPWAKLLPAPEALAVQPGALDPRRWIAVARTPDVIVAYIPVGGEVRFTDIKGMSRARWFNPRTGAWSTAAISGTSFSAPDAGDWVLVLDKAGERPRLVVLTDIGGDPDDQQSMVRLLAYANEFDIEGLIASASGTPGELKEHVVRPDLIRETLEAYRKVRANLISHAAGFPEAHQLVGTVKAGNRFRGEAAIGAGRDTEGSRWLIEVVDREDSRPVNVAIWGGPTELAQALWRVRADRSEAQVQRFVSKLRVYAVGHQDDSGPWILKNFPGLFYVLASVEIADVSGQPSKGRDKRLSVYRGMYLTGDESLTSRSWIDEHIRRGHGPLGMLYPPKTWTAPNPHGAMKEGDTPSWFYFLANGLTDPEHPEWGSWGGRFREIRPRVYNDIDTEDARLSISRWRRAFQNEFAARMDWCATSDYGKANHPPTAVLNGDRSKAVAYLSAASGESVSLTAEGSFDPDEQLLNYRWYLYPENSLASVDNAASPRTRVHLRSGAGSVHAVLEVTDNGHPALTSYRRAVIAVQPAERQNP